MSKNLVSFLVRFKVMLDGKGLVMEPVEHVISWVAKDGEAMKFEITDQWLDELGHLDEAAEVCFNKVVGNRQAAKIKNLMDEYMSNGVSRIEAKKRVREALNLTMGGVEVGGWDK